MIPVLKGLAAAVLVSTAAAAQALGGIQLLRSAGSFPPHVAGAFGEERGVLVEQAPDGSYVVLDRATHSVHAVTADRRSVRRIVDIGHEDGAVFMPTGLDVGPDGSFAVLDRPAMGEPRARVQVFDASGRRRWGFSPAVELVSRIPAPGGGSVNPPLGAGSIRYTGTSVLLSHPQSGRLMTEYSPAGKVLRAIGALRKTGAESDRASHIELNVGLPLIDPAGGYYYVFITGEPRFRKYDEKGSLLLDRVVSAREIAGPADKPAPVAAIRTAAVSPDGHLWLALATPLVYVYDDRGINTRVLQLRGAGPIRPTSLSFANDGRLLATPGFYEFDTP